MKGRAHGRRPLSRQELLQRNPLVRAAARATVDADLAGAEDKLRDSLRAVRFKLFELRDGQDATEPLSLHGYYLALAAQVLVKLGGPSHPELRPMHGALRNVHAMCLAGYRWQHALAPVIEQALVKALEVLMQHPSTALRWEPAAEVYRQRILSHSVERDDVVGAELYRDTN